MPTNPANRLLNQAAREVLRPLGLVQKGRSRTWWDDHGWWVTQVEFQPSGFDKGSYLNVGIGWLWVPEERPYVPFDGGYRVEGFWQYQSPEQWEPVAHQLAERAADEVSSYRDLVPDLQAAAALCVREDLGYKDGLVGWHTWYAAVASGLVGDVERARDRFEAVVASSNEAAFWRPVRERAVGWGDLVARDHDAFVGEVRAQVAANRVALRLDPVHPRLAQRGGSTHQEA